MHESYFLQNDDLWFWMSRLLGKIEADMQRPVPWLARIALLQALQKAAISLHKQEPASYDLAIESYMLSLERLYGSMTKGQHLPFPRSYQHLLRCCFRKLDPKRLPKQIV